MTTWKLYLITRLDNICSFFDLMILLGSIVIFFMGLYWFFTLKDDDFKDEEEEKTFNKDMKKRFSVTIFITLLFSFLSIVTPTKKEFLEIYAGSWVTNSEEMKSLPDNTVKAINKLLDDYINSDTKK